MMIEYYLTQYNSVDRFSTIISPGKNEENFAI